MSERPPEGTATAILTGLRCRCPRCGRGRLFDGLLRVAKRCGVCGLDLQKEDAGDGPAVFIICVLGFLVVPLGFLLDAVATPPIWVHLLVWPFVIVGLAIALLRPMKGVLIALQFKHQASDSGTVKYD